jgi:Bacterial dnaA protein helix-turn-helix
MFIEIEPIPHVSLAILIARKKELRARLWQKPSTGPYTTGFTPPRSYNRANAPPPGTEQPSTDLPPEPDTATASLEMPSPRPATIRNIVAEVAAFYCVSPYDILSGSRKQRFVRPRQIACYLAKSLTQKSLPEIGRRIGGRDHTTVLHGTRKIARLIASNETLANEIEDLRQRFIPPQQKPASVASPSDTFATLIEAQPGKSPDATQ